MNHAITLGGLLVAFGILGGLALLAAGAMMTFAGMMSDAPAAGASAQGKGCGVLIAGVVLIALAIAAAVR